jgi:CHASE2 domain-containing sensor protein
VQGSDWQDVEAMSDHRRRNYFWLMGVCIGLIVLAWNVVRLFSVPLAIAMSVVAAVIPPAAAIIANWTSPVMDGKDRRD